MAQNKTNMTSGIKILDIKIVFNRLNQSQYDETSTEDDDFCLKREMKSDGIWPDTEIGYGRLISDDETEADDCDFELKRESKSDGIWPETKIGCSQSNQSQSTDNGDNDDSDGTKFLTADIQNSKSMVSLWEQGYCKGAGQGKIFF